jgi:hypothetical protein
VRGEEESILGVQDFFKGREPKGKDESQLSIEKETRTYDQLLEEIVAWNIEKTDILEVLRSEVEEERLAAWSLALETGVRKGLMSAPSQDETGPLYPVFLDLYRFVRGLREKLLTNPTMKDAKRMEKSDTVLVCILCGIRVLQRERGAKRLMDTLQWMLLERYLG